MLSDVFALAAGAQAETGNVVVWHSICLLCKTVINWLIPTSFQEKGREPFREVPPRRWETPPGADHFLARPPSDQSVGKSVYLLYRLRLISACNLYLDRKISSMAICLRPVIGRRRAAVSGSGKQHALRSPRETLNKPVSSR